MLIKDDVDVLIKNICLLIVLAPLCGSVLAGFLRKQIGRSGAHTVTILCVAVSLVCSLYLTTLFFLGGAAPVNKNIYTWASGGELFPYSFHIGFLIDSLSAVMLTVVTFVSFLVHIYSMGYMVDDDGYQRFFSYLSLFTFAMLMLVTSNNFLQLFFGWEGVGLVSYLLIGFWYQKESAIQGNLKAFLVNRVGDFGFILAIALIMANADSVDYAQVFSQAREMSTQSIELFTGHSWSLITVICICLFIGAMGKSAQVPLHVWLPESMEGPTPISALIHAATMVTAGVFLVARMSPLFELSTTALSFVLVIGATGALFTGILGIVMNDIKRVVAYSTLSQLGYMMAAMGVSAYSAGIFHLMTHACFKALLFLGAGSVIIAMHHEQDMRKMGGLWRYMPITYITFLIGSLALVAIPPFAGFFSKDTIIEATKLSVIPGATYAYYCVAIGAFVTSVYTFRAFFLTFHGKPRMDAHTMHQLKESPAAVCIPLILLAIPSVLLGYILIEPMLFAKYPLLSNAVFILPEHNVLKELAKEIPSPLSMVMHAVFTPTFWFAVAGVLLTWFMYIVRPSLPAFIAKHFSLVYKVLINKYGFDAFNEKVLMRLTKGVGQLFYFVGDRVLIDGLVVNGIGKTVKWAAKKGRAIQTGYLFHYASVMIISLLMFLCLLIYR